MHPAARVLLASIALACLACGGDRSSPGSAPSAGSNTDSIALAPPPLPLKERTFADTALADSPRVSPTEAPETRSERPLPRTAPRDRATAPERTVATVQEPTVAPESAAVEPHVVPAPRSSSADDDGAPLRRPFVVGERLTYEVRFGPIPVGTATMEVLGVETLRGREAYHTRFDVSGGNRLYRVRDRYESWFDAKTLSSLRYVQDIDQGSYERHSVFEIYPDDARFIEAGKEPQPSVAQPLDEGSFLYWMRTIPLEVGETYTFDRYFRPDRNPVTIQVLRRERVRVPAGEFDAIVVRPTIKTRGIFSEGGRAEIWFADDSTRRILQMKSRLSFGSLNLYLK